MKSKENQNSKVDSEKVSFWDRVYHGKGTVAEPWPEVEEVLKKQEVQDEIAAVHRAFEKGKLKNEN